MTLLSFIENHTGTVCPVTRQELGPKGWELDAWSSVFTAHLLYRNVTRRPAFSLWLLPENVFSEGPNGCCDVSAGGRRTAAGG